MFVDHQMKKLLVPIKRVPDYQMKVRIAPDGKGVVTDGIKWIINPFDEIAVEEALRIKEAHGGAVEVVTVSIGPATVSEQLRATLAMGADRAVLVVTDGEVIADQVIDSSVAADVIAALFAKDSYDLVILGKQAIDSDAHQTGQLVAAKLGLPQATAASKVVIENDWSFAEVTREVDGGLETVKVALPAVVTTDLRLNEPRYPSLPNIVKAKKKPLEELPLHSLALGDLKPKVKVVRMELPAGRKAGVKVAGVSELIDKLQNEAKVV